MRYIYLIIFMKNWKKFLGKIIINCLFMPKTTIYKFRLLEHFSKIA